MAGLSIVGVVIFMVFAAVSAIWGADYEFTWQAAVGYAGMCVGVGLYFWGDVKARRDGGQL